VTPAVRRAVGVKSATFVVALNVTVPATATFPDPASVNVVLLIVAGFMASLKPMDTVAFGQAMFESAVGEKETTEGATNCPVFWVQQPTTKTAARQHRSQSERRRVARMRSSLFGISRRSLK
jgi:hypothetical protein